MTELSKAEKQAKLLVRVDEAKKDFSDLKRVIAKDLEHSDLEKRYYCFGKVDGAVMTVRFTCRGNKVRIIGAGYWRKGRRIYEKTQN